MLGSWVLGPAQWRVCSAARGLRRCGKVDVHRPETLSPQPPRPQGSSLSLLPIPPVNICLFFFLLAGQDRQPREETGGGGEASCGGDQGGENRAEVHHRGRRVPAHHQGEQRSPSAGKRKGRGPGLSVGTEQESGYTKSRPSRRVPAVCEGLGGLCTVIRIHFRVNSSATA